MAMNSVSHKEHQRTWRLRRKLDLSPVPKAWDYLTSTEVKDMAWRAYRVASWHMRDDLGRFDRTHQELREAFAESLAEMFRDALSAHAVIEGLCWPITSKTPPYRNYPRVWEMLYEDVPDSWHPQYRLFKDGKLLPLD